MRQKPEEHVSLIERLATQAALVLDEVIPANSDVFLFDYPNFSNVGDSLIWLGQLAYLRRRNLPIRYVCSRKNYDKSIVRRRLGSNTVFLLSGGGNFGTLYPEHQRLREQLFADFQSVPIIQLPQSMHFEESNELQSTQRAIAKHGATFLLARDNATLSFARQSFDCDVRLCPDMAFFLGPLQPLSPHVDLVALCRGDIEAQAEVAHAIDSVKASASIRITDWLRGESAAEMHWNKLIRRTRGVRRLLDSNNKGLHWAWRRLAEARLDRGVEILSSGRAVVTDRLHGHVLSLLLGRPHLIVDNNNGKVSEFHRTWTYSSDLTQLVEAAVLAETIPLWLERVTDKFSRG